MKRFPVLLALLLCLVVVSSRGVLGQVDNTGATTVPDHVTLTWTGDPASTVTITWRTAAGVSVGVVQYQAGAALTPAAKAEKAVAREFNTDLGTAQLFTATLAGLAANTQYAYRVGHGEHWSDTRTFTTADPRANAFKFLVFGDSQSVATGSAPYAVWRDTVRNAFKAHPDARFMVNVGDLVDTGQSGAHWNAWFAAAAGVIDSIPVMPVVGNHETYGMAISSKPTYWNNQFVLPQNGPEGVKNQAYAFDYGSVHFVVLDSQQSEQKRHGDIFTPQQKWLDADLAASKATWKVVFFHKTPYDLKEGRANAAVKDAFCPTIERHHVDLVINGHDHGIARTYPLRNDICMKNPSQGTIYYIAGRSGTKRYWDLQKKPYHAFFHDPHDQPNYLTLEVAGTKLTINSLNQDGTLIDTFTIDKATDTTTDPLQPAAAAAAPK
jgi:hypothetical protein